MKNKIIILCLVLIFIVSLVSSCGPAPTPEPTPVPTVHPGKSLVTTKCIGCHDINRVTNASYNADGWKLTVDRMVMSGTQLTEDQAELVVDYLSATYPKE